MKLFHSPDSASSRAFANPPVIHALRWAVVCWVIVFWRMDYVALVDDGAHYAQLTREMLQQRSWLVPLLDGSPFIDKPVLFHWLQGLAFRLFGENEMAARAHFHSILSLPTRFLKRVYSTRRPGDGHG
jgi:hypothetical protein